MFRHFRVQLLDSPIRSMGKGRVYKKRQGFYSARVAYFPIRSAEANFPTAWVNQSIRSCPHLTGYNSWKFLKSIQLRSVCQIIRCDMVKYSDITTLLFHSQWQVTDESI